MVNCILQLQRTVGEEEHFLKKIISEKLDFFLRNCNLLYLVLIFQEIENVLFILVAILHIGDISFQVDNRTVLSHGQEAASVVNTDILPVGKIYVDMISFFFLLKTLTTITQLLFRIATSLFFFGQWFHQDEGCHDLYR